MLFMEDYKIKKQEREEKRDAERQKILRLNQSRKIKRAFLWITILAAIIAAAYWGIQKSAPQGPDASAAYPIQGRDHITEGGSHPPYNSNPPSSGWHYASPALTGFYDEPIADEYVIHNLEHGDVWIAYHPRISGLLKEELKKFDANKVILTPRDANDFDIALVAWGRVDKFNIENTLGSNRIRDFIKRYTNQGPERIPTSAHK